jgi:Cu-Zn family superoxide dismutase
MPASRHDFPHLLLHLILAALSAAFLGISASAQPLPGAYSVAFFDDQRSFIVANEGLNLPLLDLTATLVLTPSVNFSDTIVSLYVYPYGDIASDGGLDVSTRKLLTEITNPPCVTPPGSQQCVATVGAGPAMEFGGWCFLVGKAVVADVSVDGVRSSMKAVFGFGNMSSSLCPFAASYQNPVAAIVKLQPVGPSGVTGTIIFQLLGNALSVSGVVSGFKPSSSHGMHVHTFGDISDVAGASRTGMHFLFPGQLHGLVGNSSRHTGDLGNIVADQNGVSAFNILVPLDLSPERALTLLAANGSAIGRSVIVRLPPSVFSVPPVRFRNIFRMSTQILTTV